MTIIKAAIAALLAATTLTACETNAYGERRLNSTGKGAAIGAAGGAVVGAIDDKNRYEERNGRRYYYDRERRDRRYYYNDRRERIYEDPRY